jgi:hypothetical protein
MRKPRTDSTLDYLPDEQAEQLMEWILGRVPYRSIVEQMREQYDVETSIGAISKYWQKWGAEHWKARRADALQMARDVVADAAANPGQFSQAALEAIEQKVFALALDPESSSKEVKGLAQILMQRGDQDIRRGELALKAKAQERAERQLELAREKFEAAEARLSAARDAMKRLDEAGGLTPEARAEIEKAMGIL